ncbi:hypothetical protein E6W17_06025 [Streptomyces sp. A1547]|nr:BBE domain-containing protein [Streptomyces sp. A1547]THA40763.1 hypothetical protein E6W17_06025 [Streptomyces sp. A1547]
MGGASGRPEPGETAYPHRDATFVIDIGTRWTPRHPAGRRPPAAGPDPRPAPYALPRPGGARRIRQLPRPGPHDWQSAYYGDNYARLLDVKRRYDPSGLFHYAQAIGT